jgi:biotin operon repressor
MMTAEEFLYEVDYLINNRCQTIADVAMVLGVSEAMVVDAVQILKDAFMDTEQ